MHLLATLLCVVSVAVSPATTQSTGDPADSFRKFSDRFVSAMQKPADKHWKYQLASFDLKKTDSLITPLIGTLTVKASFVSGGEYTFVTSVERYDLRFAPDGESWKFLGGERTIEKQVITSGIDSQERGPSTTTLNIGWADRYYAILNPPPPPPIVLPFSQTEEYRTLFAACREASEAIEVAKHDAENNFKTTEEARAIIKRMESLDAKRKTSKGQEKLDAGAEWVKLRDKLSLMQKEAIDTDSQVIGAIEAHKRAREAFDLAAAEYSKHPTTLPSN